MTDFTKVLDGGVTPGTLAERSATAQLCQPIKVSSLKCGEFVFVFGEAKNFIFRVESGTVDCRWRSLTGTVEHAEAIGPGTVFGTGFLDEHICDAVALTDCKVSCWTKSALPFLEEIEPETRGRRALETEREFVYRRKALIASAPTAPHERLAGFLCIASRINAAEGRDPCVIDESVECSSVGAYLKMDMETLGQALVELRNRGLVTHEPPRGLRIIDLKSLRSLAAEDEVAAPVSPVRERAHA